MLIASTLTWIGTLTMLPKATNLGLDDRERGIMMTTIMLTMVVPMFKYAFALVGNFQASSKP
jgi:hypothetical protein